MFAMATIDCPELAPILEILRELKDTGSEYKGVKLKGLERTDGAANNAEVLSYLGEQGRAFGNLFPFEAEHIATIGAKEYDTQIQKAFDAVKRKAAKSARAAGRAIGIKGKALTAMGKQAAANITMGARTEKLSKQMAGAVLRACMRMYMEIVGDHIKKQFAPGGVKTPLNEDYEKEKKRAVGFIYPIGVRTGQLRENLDPAFTSARITLEK